MLGAVLVTLFSGWIDHYNTRNEMGLTHTHRVFLMPLGIKVVSSNSVHIVLLEVDCNFHSLKALTL